MPDAEQLFFLLIDGDEPASWAPWERPFEALAAKLSETRTQLSRAQVGQRQFRISLLLHSPEVVASRSISNFVRVVGVVVDGMKPEEDAQRKLKLKDCLAVICNNLLRTDASSMYRQVGFYLIVAAENESAEHIEFRQELETIAEFALGTSVPLEVWSVEGDDFLLKAINHQTRSMNRNSRRYSGGQVR